MSAGITSPNRIIESQSVRIIEPGYSRSRLDSFIYVDGAFRYVGSACPFWGCGPRSTSSDPIVNAVWRNWPDGFKDFEQFVHQQPNSNRIRKITSLKKGHSNRPHP